VSQRLTVATLVAAEDHQLATVQVRGEIDHFTVQPLVEQLEVCCDRGTDVIVDMAQVTFMDVAGVNCVARAASRLATSGCTVLVQRAPSTIRAVFEACDADVYLLPDSLSQA
jgi:anti-anti-sigma factor